VNQREHFLGLDAQGLHKNLLILVTFWEPSTIKAAASWQVMAMHHKCAQTSRRDFNNQFYVSHFLQLILV